MNWYIQVLKKYAVFSGRARRKEFWMFVLFNIIISIVIGLIERLLGLGSGDGAGVLSIIYSLAVLLPSLGVSVRRLHDIDKTGWWLLIALIPVIGAIVLLIFFVKDSQAGENQYGLNPKAGAAY